MRQGVGATVTFNIIFIYLLVIFAILCATISYYKAYKVNSMILASIDKYEGYNNLAQGEINDYLDGIGYMKVKSECKPRKNMIILTTSGTNYTDGMDYCVYYAPDDANSKSKRAVNGKKEPSYYNYAVLTYLRLDLPIINAIKIPVYTKGERIFNFTTDDNYKSKGGGTQTKGSDK